MQHWASDGLYFLVTGDYSNWHQQFLNGVNRPVQSYGKSVGKLGVLPPSGTDALVEKEK